MSLNLGIINKIKQEEINILNAKRRLAYAKNTNDDKRKTRRICDWKAYGVLPPIKDDWEGLYQHFINTKNCDDCGVEFDEGGSRGKNKRCIDHCHFTGMFRGIVCNSCNIKRR
jgi:hypothetical protein